ncbi:MAG: RecQ family ATP-dependent DNA helicase [Bacteroidetes bacterium]|nr:MAG: RecQ family ATP-dependent DNA helicase [Bacteroidota bacterium]REJ99869.1 MAG: RecQ family ATP-dependent DNA helicase [Bacteroidota bacterium]REK34242.1 MAG: RecQ family ATP-dependent DNA helicase [Bacteroidota bacterium]REK50572.1 MAG: RecQ family ATP-dependent DNA helicase [Bacteroidota bacterium]
MQKSIHQILKDHWGYIQFRPLQEDIINSVLQGNDTLALMPTGGGKSICFQVPAMALEGVCIVISPLIALMKDQVNQLKARGIPASAAVSGMTSREIDATLDNCIHGKEKFLYVSPERLGTEIFRLRLQKMNVCLIAVDEAHCISQWGYDFRPAYLNIAEIRNELPDVSVLALTATATHEVQEDIMRRLNFHKQNIFKKSFERKNLSYSVLEVDDKLTKMASIFSKVPGSGIVYLRSRKRTVEIANYLKSKKISAGYYHAGMASDERDKAQQLWMEGKMRVMAATNAFGMGIDKGDVRSVVHLELPDNIESYYQEAGRAGRDEQKAYAVLLYNNSDRVDMERRVSIGFPEKSQIRNVYNALGNNFQIPEGSGKGMSFDFDLPAFSSSYNFPVRECYNSLRLLELQGLISISESLKMQSRVRLNIRAGELYEFQVKNKELDNFIKALLRTYGGLFDNYVDISEDLLSKRLKITVADVVSYLNRLSKLNVVEYFPASEKPKITFMESRIPPGNLAIDKNLLEARKVKYIQRAKAMLNYAEAKDKCRSLMLLSYFGEESWHRCGVCDYCVKRNKSGVSDLEFESITQEVKEKLNEREHSLEELMSLLSRHSEESNQRVIEWLLDNEYIGFSAGNNLKWINTKNSKAEIEN